MSSRDIHILLNKKIDELTKPWKATLQFPVIELLYGALNDPKDISHSLSKSPISDRDICSYFNGQSASVARLYFDPTKYVPPSPGEKLVRTNMKRKATSVAEQSWNALFVDLARSAMHDGTVLISNGGKDKKVIMCEHRSKVRNTAYCPIVPTKENPLRVTSLTKDRKNERHLGKGAPGAPRRTIKPKRSLGCKFRFTISWDDHGYFIPLERNAGNQVHMHHPRSLDPNSLSIPTRFLREHEVEETVAASDANACYASGRNYLRRKIGKYFNRMKVAYLQSSEKDDTLSQKNDIRQMLDMFENSNEICFTSLSDVPIDQYIIQDSSVSSNLTSTDPKETADSCKSPTKPDESVAEIIADQDPVPRVTKTVKIASTSTNTVHQEDLTGDDTMPGLADQIGQEREDRDLKPNDVLFIAVA